MVIYWKLLPEEAVGQKAVGLEILGCAACGQVSACAEKDTPISVSLSTQVDTRRLRLIAEDFNPTASLRHGLFAARLFRGGA